MSSVIVVVVDVVVVAAVIVTVRQSTIGFITHFSCFVLLQRVCNDDGDDD